LEVKRCLHLECKTVDVALVGNGNGYGRMAPSARSEPDLRVGEEGVREDIAKVVAEKGHEYEECAVCALVTGLARALDLVTANNSLVPTTRVPLVLSNGCVGGPLDIRLGLDGLGGDIGVAAEVLGSWEIEKLRKLIYRGPPEPDDAEAEPASVAREARRGSGPREGGLPDLTLDPPALRRFGAGGESGDRSRIARVDSRRRAIFFSDGGGGRGRSS
jgi:hypothetical protein